MNHRKTLIAALVGAACATATAETINPNALLYDICGWRKVTYINGITTYQSDANEDLEVLKQVYGNSYKKHPVQYQVAYNQTGGFPTDFHDSVMQVLKGYTSATWDGWYQAVQSAIYTYMPLSTAQKISKTVDDMYSLTKPSPYQDRDLTTILNNIGPNVAYWRGRMNVFVCHSQGNLYCNLVYDKLIAAGVPSQQMGFVGVAVPYWSVPTGNTYVTSTNDLVIDSVRTALLPVPLASAPLPGNATAPYDPNKDITGHSFNETYLTSAATRNKITAGIDSEFNGLRQTQIKTADIDPAYTFSGRAQWRDCSIDLDAYGYTRYRATRPSSCGQGYPANMPSVLIAPVVDIYPAGMGTITTRAGSPGETPGLATTMRDGCIALAAGFYKTLAATGTVAGDNAGYCSQTWQWDPISNVRLASRYKGFISGDGYWTKTTPWQDPYYTMGGANATKGPICRN